MTEMQKEALDETNSWHAAGASFAGLQDMPIYEEIPQPALSWGARSWRFVRDLFRMRADRSAQRVMLVGMFFLMLFATLIGRLSWIAMHPKGRGEFQAGTMIAAARPDILDRNGIVLATDIKTVSVYAEPRNIIDADEATELLTAVLPGLDARDLREKLSTNRGFVWVKRQITPRQQEEVHRLGLPGIGFVPENKRVYPNGPIGAHVLGFANVDNEGIAGIEKYIDNQGLKALAGYGLARSADDLEPIKLSLDLRATAAARDELMRGLEYFRAKAAASLILDVNTGEVISLVSLPDYDPNNPIDALKADRINRMIVGVFEMGSTFKALTLAMGLDSDKANINSTYDARGALHVGRFTIKDYHGQNRILNVPEIFVYSSNIGTARIALQQGVSAHRAFLKKMGQLDRMRTEMPESSAPLLPPNWGELNTITIAYGHGLAVAPMQAASAVGALVNGGQLVSPTFLLRSEEEARANAPRVIKPETSEAMRYILRLNAERGTARKADIPGYFIGGKTGTADKVINGRYAKDKNFTTFMTILPADDPKYLFLTVYDEPQATPESHGYSTAAWNAGVTTGKIMERVAPLLGLPPRFEYPKNAFPTMVRLGAWGTR